MYPGYLYSAARCAEKAGREPAALAMYQKLVTQREQSGKWGVKAARRIAALKKMQKQREAKQPPVVVAPAPPPARTPSAPKTAPVAKPARPKASRPVIVAPTMGVRSRPNPNVTRATTALTDTAAHPTTVPSGTFVAVGVGLAAVGVSIWQFTVYKDAKEQYQGGCRPSPSDCRSYDAGLNDESQNLAAGAKRAASANLAFGLGMGSAVVAVGAAAATVWLASSRRDGGSKLAIFPSHGGRGLVAILRF